MTTHVFAGGPAVNNNRIFFIHAAIEEFQTTGYLTDQTLSSLSRDEYQLVMERGRLKDNN